MNFGDQMANTGPLVIAAIAVSAVSLATAVVLFIKFRAATRPFSVVQSDEASTSELLQAVLQTADRAEKSVEQLDSRFAAHVGKSREFLRQTGLVRYDAFDNVAGKQSFSLCLLNEDRDGVLITYLASKGATRSYAVPINRGKPARGLSEEEERALGGAVSSEAELVST